MPEELAISLISLKNVRLGYLPLMHMFGREPVMKDVKYNNDIGNALGKIWVVLIIDYIMNQSFIPLVLMDNYLILQF